MWLTGATGFIGGVIARQLIEHGDEVIAPVRDRSRAGGLLDLGATVVETDLTNVRRLTDELREVDAVVHAAGDYRVGIPRSEHGAMWEANIGLTTRVLDAAEAARVQRVVYVSTCNVFGDTHGEIVDEGHRRDLRAGFLSWYDETKFGAHEVVEQRIRGGAPVVIVLPSGVYGPGDHTALGDQVRRAFEGRLRVRALDAVGLGFVHVEDLVRGIVAALDRGETGQSYVLSGPTARLADVLATAAQLGGRGLPPRVPSALLGLVARGAAVAGRPEIAEVVRAGDGVTYWATARKAEAALGFRPRSIEDGLRATFGLGTSRSEAA